MTHDNSGREYALLSKLKGGTFVEVDSGFTCMSAGRKIVYVDRKEKFICCSDGRHFLDGQLASDGDHLIGIYPTEDQPQ